MRGGNAALRQPKRREDSLDCVTFPDILFRGAFPSFFEQAVYLWTMWQRLMVWCEHWKFTRQSGNLQLDGGRST